MTAPRPKGTKRADLRALVDAGKRYHAAKLAYGYTLHTPVLTKDWMALWDALHEAKTHLVHAAERYAVGQRKSSVAFAHKHYAKSKAKP